MPAASEKQPEYQTAKLHKKKGGALKMSGAALSEYASKKKKAPRTTVANLMERE